MAAGLAGATAVSAVLLYRLLTFWLPPAAGLLAYGDANAIVMEMAREVLPIVKDTPVLAGKVKRATSRRATGGTGR